MAVIYFSWSTAKAKKKGRVYRTVSSVKNNNTTRKTKYPYTYTHYTQFGYKYKIEIPLFISAAQTLPGCIRCTFIQIPKCIPTASSQRAIFRNIYTSTRTQTHHSTAAQEEIFWVFLLSGLENCFVFMNRCRLTVVGRGEI